MARLLAVICLLIIQTLLTLAQTWNGNNGLFCHSFSGPLRTTSRSLIRGPLFFTARPFLTLFPRDDTPAKPFTEATYTPETETFEVTEKTETILHKLHKVIEELLKDEEGHSEEYFEHEKPEEESTELEDAHNEIDDSNEYDGLFDNEAVPFEYNEEEREDNSDTLDNNNILDSSHYKVDAREDTDMNEHEDVYTETDDRDWLDNSLHS